MTSRDRRPRHASAAAGAETQLPRRALRGRRSPRPPLPLAGPPPACQPICCATGRRHASGGSDRQQQPPLAAAEPSAVHGHGHGALNKPSTLAAAALAAWPCSQSVRRLLCPRRIAYSICCDLVEICALFQHRASDMRPVVAISSDVCRENILRQDGTSREALSWLCASATAYSTAAHGLPPECNMPAACDHTYTAVVQGTRFSPCPLLLVITQMQRNARRSLGWS